MDNAGNVIEIGTETIGDNTFFLNDPDYAEIKTAAYDDANKALYRERLTYGFDQDMCKAGPEMVVPKGAEVLLETRLPYLNSAQRRVVLYTTGIDSGYPVLDETNGWGRLDLIAAADGYGAFYGDVYVNMDGSLGGFHATDSWDNDINGQGMLTKDGKNVHKSSLGG